MERNEFINLIGQDVVVDYPFFQEVQKWSMKNFTYDPVTDTIRHKRISDLNVEVFLKNARNPHPGKPTSVFGFSDTLQKRSDIKCVHEKFS